MENLNTKALQLKYYKARCISLMNNIEDITKKIFTEIDGQLEKRFWAAYDSNSVLEMRKVYTSLAEIHDILTMDAE